MEAHALNPRALFDGTVCYEVPPFQRPYVWTEEDQWQPLWDDIVRVTDASGYASGDPALAAGLREGRFASGFRRIAAAVPVAGTVPKGAVRLAELPQCRKGLTRRLGRRRSQ